MKKFYLTFAVVLFLLFFVNRGQAQTTMIKLNQAELMKKFIGKWKNVENDTTYIWECKSFGSCSGIYKSLFFW